MMQLETSFRGVAVDVGNSAVHAGLFSGARDPFPRPQEVVILDRANLDYAKLLPLIDGQKNTAWRLASVNDEVLGGLLAWLDRQSVAGARKMVTHADVPIAIDVEHPEKVGVDRLLAATAARALCGDDSPAIVVDAGTAITVDCVIDGSFGGGAILPGMRMAAAALDRYTEKLPLIDADAIDAVEVIGRDTSAAMQSGVYWGAVGAVREIVSRMSSALDKTPRILLTGGDGQRLAAHIDSAEYVPHLVLSGIALTAAHGQSRQQ